ncbi:unnamed protein product, partial [Didymodactylos carnosus]
IVDTPTEAASTLPDTTASEPTAKSLTSVALAEETIQRSANATETTSESLFPGATGSSCVQLSLGTPNRSEYDIMIE